MTQNSCNNYSLVVRSIIVSVIRDYGNNMNLKFNNLFDLLKVFSTEEKCVEFLRQSKWKDGEFCPYCRCANVFVFVFLPCVFGVFLSLCLFFSL